jgi:hypothetical protein
LNLALRYRLVPGVLFILLAKQLANVVNGGQNQNYSTTEYSDEEHPFQYAD